MTVHVSRDGGVLRLHLDKPKKRNALDDDMVATLINEVDAAGRDEVLIAEVRADANIRGGFWVWAVCDNLRRSSALNAVLVAEKALFGSGKTN